MRISKKILAFTLSILMAISMMPFTAFAGTSYGGYVVADSDNGEDLWNKEVYFNDYTWYIIEDNSTSANAGTVTLFCKDMIGESKFSVDATNNHYSTSTVRTYLDNLTTTGSFADVADAIVTIDSLTTNGFQSSEVYDTAENVKLYLLDKTEVENLPARVKRQDGNNGFWWVRSPGGVDPLFPDDPIRAMAVDVSGEFGADIGFFVTSTEKVRPALKLDLSKVVFDSSSKTFELAPPAPAAPQATVTEVAAPEGAAFAYKFEAPADKPTAYDAYHADFVATFDRDIKAGEVTLYGKYGDYGWVALTINEDIPAGTPYRIYQNLMNDTLTYATVRDEVSPFYCGAGGAVLNEANMTVQLKLYPVEGGVEGTPVDASETVTDTIEAIPMATVTEVTAPEGAAFAYKFEADAAKPTAYDSYHADFVATFDRDIKAGEVTLYGKYGDYGWVELTINEDVPAGTPYRIYKNLMNDTLTYATVRDEVSPFYCGAGGAVLADTNMTVNFVLYPVEGGTEGAPVEASEDVTGEIEKPAVPMATVTEVTAPEGAAFAYKFEADSAKPTVYDSYHADFVATFDRDIKAGEVTLYGKYGDYGWVELTINEDVPAGTPYRIYKNLMNDTLTYATVRDEVSPFYCGAGGAVLADTNMTVNFVLYPVEGGTEGAPVEASEDVTGEIEKPEVKDKYSITINDKVELNVLIEETDVTKLGVKYNKTPDEENDGTPAEAEIISVSSLTKQDNYYVVNVPLAPAQIRDVITIDVYKGDNLDRTISTSVAKYCEAIVNNHAYTGDNAELVEALAQATLDYGKAASDYFGYNTDAYAGYTISNNTLPSLSGLVANDTTGLVTGVRYVAKSVPELRLETSLTEANFFDDEGNALYSVSCAEGYAAKFAKVGNTVVIEVKGIPASKLGEAIHLNVSGKVNGAIEYTPLAFSSVASRSSDNNLKALGIAIANYGVAAANLF